MTEKSKKTEGEEGRKKNEKKTQGEQGEQKKQRAALPANARASAAPERKKTKRGGGLERNERGEEEKTRGKNGTENMENRGGENVKKRK
jgi:hypothetical protein